MSYSCHICGKYFSKPFNLHRHKRKVHDQKPTDNIRMATNGGTVRPGLLRGRKDAEGALINIHTNEGAQGGAN